LRRAGKEISKRPRLSGGRGFIFVFRRNQITDQPEAVSPSWPGELIREGEGLISFDVSPKCPQRCLAVIIETSMRRGRRWRRFHHAYFCMVVSGTLAEKILIVHKGRQAERRGGLEGRGKSVENLLGTKI